jgi:hypothetical protein
MDEEQVNEVFDGLIAAARAAQGGGTDAGSGSGSGGAPPQPPAQPTIDYKEALDPNSERFNPEGAFKHFVTTNYGSLLTDLAGRTVAPMVDQVARAVGGDFEKYRGDVQEILKKRDPMSLTAQEVVSAYYMAKGLRTTEAERAAASRAATTTPPSPPAEETTTVKLSPEEEDVARRMFVRHPDPVKAYLEYAKKIEEGEGSFSVGVPLGGGKKG